jgi:hypothetical protein
MRPLLLCRGSAPSRGSTTTDGGFQEEIAEAFRMVQERDGEPVKVVISR